MLIRIHPDNPTERLIQMAVDILQRGGLVIYPTDTVYAIGCDIQHPKAIHKLALIKGKDPNTADFSFICYDLSDLSRYARQVPNDVFKLMKKNLPGPYTFILNASSNVPKLLQNKKKTVGIRIPDNQIPLEIVRTLGNAILTTSVRDDDEIMEYITDPELIHERYENLVDLVIDGGAGNVHASTIVDCTNSEFEIIRQGQAELIF